MSPEPAPSVVFRDGDTDPARQGSLFDSADQEELDELRARCDVLVAENTRLRDQQAVRIREEREQRERMESAIRRTAERDKVVFASHWIGGLVGERGGHALWWVVRAVKELPDRPTAADVDKVRTAATSAAAVLGQFQSDRSSDAAAAYYQQTKAEVTWLRDFVRRRGQELHAAYGRDASGCTCVGCLLIVDMDVRGVDLAEVAS